jgi:hypothetical protein
MHHHAVARVDGYAAALEAFAHDATGPRPSVALEERAVLREWLLDAPRVVKDSHPRDADDHAAER